MGLSPRERRSTDLPPNCWSCSTSSRSTTVLPSTTFTPTETCSPLTSWTFPPATLRKPSAAQCERLRPFVWPSTTPPRLPFRTPSWTPTRTCLRSALRARTTRGKTWARSRKFWQILPPSQPQPHQPLVQQNLKRRKRKKAVLQPVECSVAHLQDLVLMMILTKIHLKFVEQLRGDSHVVMQSQ